MTHTGWRKPTPGLLQAEQHAKVGEQLAAASDIIQKVISADDRAERSASYVADVVLAKFLGWDHPLPITALHMKKTTLRDLRDGKAGSGAAVQYAITKGVQSASVT